MIGAFEKMAHGLISAKAGLWAGKVLSALGLGFVAQQYIYEPLIEQAVQAWNLVPAQLAAWVSALGIDVGVSLVLSAYGIRGASRIFMRRMENSA
jgi:hypothetical protein